MASHRRGSRLGVSASAVVQRLARNQLIRQALRFGLTTALSAVVTVGLPVLLHEVFGVQPRIAVAVAFVVAFCMNFISLRRIVFTSDRNAGHDLLIFAVSSMIFRFGEYLGFLGISALLDLSYVWCLLTVLACSTLIKFFWYRQVMHRPIVGTRSSAPASLQSADA